MKKKYATGLAILISVFNGLFGQIIKVDSYGNIILKPYNISKSVLIREDYGEPQIIPSVAGTGYLGTSSNYWWRLASRYIQYTYTQTLSDRSVKENIGPIENSLDSLKKINGIHFDFNESAFLNEPGEKKTKLLKQGKNSYGFLAQDLMKVFPNLVSKEEDGLLYANYEGLIPVLVEAVKAQQKQIETLQKIVAQHEEELIALKEPSNSTQNESKQKSTANLDIENSGNTTLLFQNSPNPFSSDTKIEFFLPTNISNASIIIHDIQGSEIKQIKLLTKGAGSIIIRGSELKAGIYLYTLIVNDSIIDTKRMILSEL